MTEKQKYALKVLQEQEPMSSLDLDMNDIHHFTIKSLVEKGLVKVEDRYYSLAQTTGLYDYKVTNNGKTTSTTGKRFHSLLQTQLKITEDGNALRTKAFRKKYLLKGIDIGELHFQIKPILHDNSL